MKYTAKEVEELFNELRDDCKKAFVVLNVEKFLTDKGIINEPKEMTVQQIQDKLGYEVKIVK